MLFDPPEQFDAVVDQRRARYYRDDPVRWIWILYGLAQATVTMLMAFGVIETTTAAAVVTAVALVIYVAVNEIVVRPARTRAVDRPEHEHEEPPEHPPPYDGADDPVPPPREPTTPDPFVPERTERPPGASGT